MYKLAWTKTDEFNEMRESGVIPIIFAELCQNAKYERTADLTTRELIDQLSKRASMLDMFDNSISIIEYHFEQWFQMFDSDSLIIQDLDSNEIMIDLKSMLANESTLSEWQTLLINEGVEARPQATPDTAILSGIQSVRPLSVATLKRMMAVARKYEFSDLDDFSARYIHSPSSESFNEKYKDTHGRLITLSINLADSSDEEILAELRELLILWREETDSPSMPSPSRVSCVNLKKIINNKYLLLLDGMLFSRIFDFAISDEQLIQHIYPNLVIQPDSFRKTYKFNARAFANAQCITAWEQKMTPLALWERPVLEAMDHKF
ncbi:DUF6387 family protein [Aeromonas caviae]|uniref:DUF6387 family protein n=1 Tax=Aeromonas caviae TaxID=648 RepID=UPI0029D5C3C3|nr:DUF6387 family protein [Aeromonas caviae]MDX7872075.1 DUF6387 family protein [Aeromonas caviae]